MEVNPELSTLDPRNRVAVVAFADGPGSLAADHVAAALRAAQTHPTARKHVAVVF